MTHPAPLDTLWRTSNTGSNSFFMIQLHEYEPHKNTRARLRIAPGLAREKEILMQPQYITLPKQAKDITGQRFGRLVALGPIGQNANTQIVWRCICDCCNFSDVQSTHLVSGNTKSCGCLHNELTSSRQKTHGMAGTALYRKWETMISRCHNPSVDNYAHYGGRGIAVCDEWRHDFQAFRDHVLPLPHCGEPGYSLDRIDNDGNYEPGNVRWATQSEQTRNTRTNRMITYNGRTQCLAAWAEQLQIASSTLSARLDVFGWDIERAFTTRPRRWSRK